jgi:hypothetical protein
MGDHPAARDHVRLHPAVRPLRRHGQTVQGPARCVFVGMLPWILRQCRDARLRQPHSNNRDQRGLLPADHHPAVTIASGLVDFAISFVVLLR